MALNEIARASKVGILIDEQKIPIKNETAGICKLLGFDPLYVANEGKLIAIVAAEHVAEVLAAVKQDKFGQEARIVGEVISDHPGKVVLATKIDGTRIIAMLAGGPLPRIC